MSGCTGRRRRVGRRTWDGRQGRRTGGRDRRRVRDLMCGHRHRGRNPVGRTTARDPDMVGPMGALDPNPVDRMVARDRSLVSLITAGARDRNRGGLITAVRGRSRTDLTEARRIGRRRRRQGSDREEPMRGRPAPTNPTNVRRRNRSDPLGLAPERVCNGSQIARSAIPLLSRMAESSSSRHISVTDRSLGLSTVHGIHGRDRLTVAKHIDIVRPAR
jgi:hypothetical protein